MLINVNYRFPQTSYFELLSFCPHQLSRAFRYFSFINAFLSTSIDDPSRIGSRRTFLPSQFSTFAITWNQVPATWTDRCVKLRRGEHIAARRKLDKHLAEWPTIGIFTRSVFQIPAANLLEPKQVRTTRLDSRDAEERRACDRLLGRSRFARTLRIRKQIGAQRNQQITRSNDTDRDREREEKIGKVGQPAIQRDREGRAYARLLCMHLKRGRGP